jgi:beta-1,4-mannosyl-glycoprotein beta-1,4-N-acetylglucosaminyltransferase
VLIITDVDEIPDPNTLARIKRGDIVVSINSLEMDFYYYNLNAKYRVKWTHCKIVSFQMYKNLNSDCGAIRSKNNCVPIQNGGWHLSYFGDSAFIKNKLENFSHQEYNNAEYANLSTIETRVKNFESLFINGGIHPDKIDARHNNYLPVDYDKYLKKFVLY